MPHFFKFLVTFLSGTQPVGVLGDRWILDQLVLNPPNSSCTVNEIWLVSLNMAFTLQGIWCLCNHVLHNGGPADIYGSIHQIHYRFMEFSTLTNQSTRLPPPPSFASWVLPPTDWAKLNVDAAISTTKVALAVVAWNNSGDVIKVWAKLQNSCSPLLVEASSILWAAQKHGPKLLLRVTLKFVSTPYLLKLHMLIGQSKLC